MILQAFGELLTDILTVNPALRDIPSASAILDTSNYGFAAVSFGKDAEGFTHHAHSLSSYSTGVYNNGILTLKIYNTNSPSSYHSSATHAYFSSTYNSVPNYPSIYDSRLERGSTITNIPGTSDVGHYVNAAISNDIFASGSNTYSVSNAWNVIGGFPPSGNSSIYALYDSSGGFVTSGNLSGVFNTHSLMDKNGFLKTTQVTITDASPDSVPWTTAGAKVAVQVASFNEYPEIDIYICPQMGDAASLAAFGGINHIGVWCLDIKQMLADGLRPPFAWNALDNTRKYKLIGKATFWKDLLHHKDDTSLGLSGYAYLLALGTTSNVLNRGPVYNLKLTFI
jgi:hypothetical protein